MFCFSLQAEEKQKASAAFAQLRAAMETLGITSDEQKAVWHVVAGIYHLGAAGACRGKEGQHEAGQAWLRWLREGVRANASLQPEGREGNRLEMPPGSGRAVGNRLQQKVDVRPHSAGLIATKVRAWRLLSKHNFVRGEHWLCELRKASRLLFPKPLSRGMCFLRTFPEYGVVNSLV